MKNPFKISNIVDTVTNVGIGGAANVAMDYARANVEALGGLDDKYYNAIKIAVGAIGGSLTKNKYLRAAVDGIATVGVSDLISDLAGFDTATPTEGLPKGTIGAIRRPVRMGNRAFRKVSGVAGNASSAFMGA